MPRIAPLPLGIGALIAISALVGFVWAERSGLFNRIAVRPSPPQLSAINTPLVSGELYTVSWTPGSTGAPPQFYYLLESITDDPTFTPFQAYRIEHKTGHTPSKSFIASAKTVKRTIYYRVVAGYVKPAAGMILSDPSNTVELTIESQTPPDITLEKFTVSSSPAGIWPGERYKLSWSAVPHANLYSLQQIVAPIDYYLTTELFEEFEAPIIPSNHAEKMECYIVYAMRQEILDGKKTKQNVTDTSGQECLRITGVKPPPFKVKSSVYPATEGKEYTISWRKKSLGPPQGYWRYQLREKIGSHVGVFPLSKETKRTFVAPGVNAAAEYSVRAFFDKPQGASGPRPMTNFSKPTTVAIIKAAPQPQGCSAVHSTGDACTPVSASLCKKVAPGFIPAGTWHCVNKQWKCRPEWCGLGGTMCPGKSPSGKYCGVCQTSTDCKISPCAPGLYCDSSGSVGVCKKTSDCVRPDCYRPEDVGNNLLCVQ